MRREREREKVIKMGGERREKTGRKIGKRERGGGKWEGVSVRRRREGSIKRREK